MCGCSMVTLFLFLHFFLLRHSLQYITPKQDRLALPRPESCWLFQKDCPHSFLTITHSLFPSPKGGKYANCGLVIHYGLIYRFFYPNGTKLSCSVLQSHTQDFLHRIMAFALSAHYSTGFWPQSHFSLFGTFTLYFRIQLLAALLFWLLTFSSFPVSHFHKIKFNKCTLLMFGILY